MKQGYLRTTLSRRQLQGFGLAVNASLPVSGLPPMVCDRDYKNKISFCGIDDAEWKALQQHPPQTKSDRLSCQRIFTQPIDCVLDIIKEIISQSIRSSVIKD
jgi:hypothetical protein